MKYLVLVILLKKTNYNTKVRTFEKKINYHDHDTYITTPEFTAENFVAKLTQINLTSKIDIANFVKNAGFQDKLKNIKQNIYLLKMNLKKLQTFDSSLFIGLFFLTIYKLNLWPPDLDSDFALGGCLFEGVKLAKNADTDKYVYSGYGIGFNMRIEYSLPDGSVSKNIIIFGVDMSSSVHIDDKGKVILILGKGPKQGLNDTMLAAKTHYSIYFTRAGIKFCLSLYYNGSNSFLFATATKIYQFKATNYEIKNIPCV